MAYLGYKNKAFREYKREQEETKKWLEVEKVRIKKAKQTQNLLKAIAIHIDNVGISGSGNNGNPTGILNTTGINSAAAFAAASTPTYLEMLGMESLVAADNALLGDLSYIFIFYFNEWCAKIHHSHKISILFIVPK